LVLAADGCDMKTDHLWGRPRIIAIDADGVLLNYNLAYASAWSKAFGEFPQERDPEAYWAYDRWAVERLSGYALNYFRSFFDEEFWSSIPIIEGADVACEMLVRRGHELVCVTAMEARYSAARKRNLQRLNLPISDVISVEHHANGVSPKATVLNELQPAAFVDDYLPYFYGVDASVYRCLVTRERNGSPNHEHPYDSVSSCQPDLLHFAKSWCDNGWHATGHRPRGESR
jgi:5' nucleotidase, deoxy (Pyrimidine), cytosolic type C protein (NT5C)